MAYEAELEFERPLRDLEKKLDDLRGGRNAAEPKAKAEIARLTGEAARLMTDLYANLTPWQRVQVARHPRRPYALDYIGLLMKDFVELHGDRGFADDPAIVCGFARLDERPILILGQQKGRDTKENLMRNFGMMNPEGYRKALRLMKLAERFHRPVLSLIDTPGAYPGIGAEERGQSEAIARNLLEMSVLRTPTVAVIIGEGGSGGALGIGVADRVMILEHSVYSVISPEGCAAILWKSAKHAPEAAKALKITARDLLDLGIVDEIIPEPPGGAHRDAAATAEAIRVAVSRVLAELAAVPLPQLLDQRYQKFRSMGRFAEAAT